MTAISQHGPLFAWTALALCGVAMFVISKGEAMNRVWFILFRLGSYLAFLGVLGYGWVIIRFAYEKGDLLLPVYSFAITAGALVPASWKETVDEFTVLLERAGTTKVGKQTLPVGGSGGGAAL